MADINYKTYTSPSGFEVLVGQDDRSNDLLTFKVARANDLWFHISGFPGSHVVMRCAESDRPPDKEDIRYAAMLAAFHSKMKGAGTVAVHYCRAGDVRKPRKAPPGQVQIKNFKQVKVKAQLPQQE